MNRREFFTVSAGALLLASTRICPAHGASLTLREWMESLAAGGDWVFFKHIREHRLGLIYEIAEQAAQGCPWEITNLMEVENLRPEPRDDSRWYFITLPEKAGVIQFVLRNGATRLLPGVDEAGEYWTYQE